jgi:phospholipid/cholesterol/gamma-HCH transport system substrate-binding protein
MVDQHVFVGDESQVDVRMLTVVGGYYVNIDPIGDVPMGGKPIPQERVTMPYSLIQTLSDTTKITKHVKPQAINASLNQIQQGLVGPNMETISAIIDAGNSLISAIERQRGQVTEILDVSNEYVRAFTDYRAKLEMDIQKI